MQSPQESADGSRPGGFFDGNAAQVAFAATDNKRTRRIHMNIGDIFRGNYSTFLNVFGGKSAPARNANPSGLPPGVTPYRPDPGMDITGRDPSSYKIVPVSDEVRNALVENARNEFLNGFGMSDGERMSAISREYIQSVPPEDRIDVSWTLGQIHLEEARRLGSLAKSAVPGWKPGDPFDQDMMRDLFTKGGMDVIA